MPEPVFLPECYGDTELFDCLIRIKKSARMHQKGVFSVAIAMKHSFKKDGGYRPVIGIVDKDKRTDRYFDSFKLLKEEQGLLLLENKAFNQHLIYVVPAFEKWILHCAETVNINPTDFKLPSDFKQFRNITKAAELGGGNPKITAFIKAVANEDPEPIRTYRQWINGFLSEE